MLKSADMRFDDQPCDYVGKILIFCIRGLSKNIVESQKEFKDEYLGNSSSTWDSWVCHKYCDINVLQSYGCPIIFYFFLHVQ